MKPADFLPENWRMRKFYGIAPALAYARTRRGGLSGGAGGFPAGPAPPMREAGNARANPRRGGAQQALIRRGNVRPVR